jgi:hypothetical protein
MIVVISRSLLKVALNHLDDFGPWRFAFQRIFIVDSKRIGTGFDFVQRIDFIDNFTSNSSKSAQLLAGR